MAIRSDKVLPNLSKLESLDGSNCRRWSQKLLMFFEQLEVNYVLNIKVPEKSIHATAQPDTVQDDSGPPKHAVVESATVDTENFKKDNKKACGHLLNHMTDFLFDLFVIQK